MAIKAGDILIMSQYGVEETVEAVTGDDGGVVQIKNKGAFAPCPVQHLHEPYVLKDPQGKGLDNGGPIYVKPNGQTTEDFKEAKLFKSPDEAERFRESHSGIGYFVPVKLSTLP
jgi:hypothetical protein